MAASAVLTLLAILVLDANANEPTQLPKAVAIGSADAVGAIYTTPQGMALYTNRMDQPDNGTFGCTDARYERTPGDEGYPIPGAAFRKTCINRWRPYLAGADDSTTGAWSVVSRPDGTRQWAYEGQPAYTSSRDRLAGDVNGTMGFASYGAWHLVPVPLWLPPGITLVRKLDGLLLGTVDERLLFSLAGRSRSGGELLQPFAAPVLAIARGEFGVVERADGSKQWTFRGEALYRPREYVANHEIQHAVRAGRWKPVIYQPARPRPAFVTMQMSVPEIGWVYADAQGHTLYAFYCFDRAADQLHCDEVGDAAAHRSAVCGTGEQCAREWRPVLAATAAESVGNWGIADVPHPPFLEATGAYGEGVPTVRAWTYHGRPVYTFVGDRVPGDVLAHGIEARSSGFGAITVLGDDFPVSP